MNLKPIFSNRFFQRLFSFFSVEHMLPKDILGSVPSTKQAYTTFLSVAWPSALESLLVGLVGSIDTMMVGSLGQGAIAAVGITNQPKFILLAMIFSLNVGVTAVVARRKGQNDQEGANRTLRTAILLSFIISLFTSLLGFIFATLVNGILPFALCFAAGAMMFVCIEELIPEANATEGIDIGTISFMIGFVIMMSLDILLS